MADNSRPVAEPLQKSAQAAQAVRGAVKTGKAIAGAAKGAAAGGVWGAVAGFAWENRKFVGKVIIAATAVLMIPILILCMLPGIIFGGFGNSHSPADPDTPIMNSSAAIDSNLVEISTAVSCVLSEALTDTLTAIENDYAACTADGKEVINPYESSPNFNANLFVGQYCAAKNEDYAAVSVSDMESMLRSGKDKLYSYTKKEEERTVETVTTSVTVDASTGKETTTETVTTTTEKWIIYTVSYNGEAYFADEVFHLTAEQKDLADDYAYNLSLFLGDSMFQGLPAVRPDDPRLPDSFALAAQRGMQFSIHPVELRSAHPNTAVLTLTSRTGRQLSLKAASVGGGRIRVTEIDGVPADFGGDSNTLIIHNEDTPGCIAEVTMALALRRINIASMQVFRAAAGGYAVMVLECDSHIPHALERQLAVMPGLLKVTCLNVDEPEETEE